MSASILTLKLPPLPQSVPLAEQLPAGRLIEIAGEPAGAQMTTAVACLRRAQARGETSAWVQRAGGSLFPPDLADSGVDLGALLVVNVPARAGAAAPAKAAELLLRSGGFGMVVIDLTGAPPPRDLAWQGRLLGLAREHGSFVLLLSDGRDEAGARASLGPLVSLCLAPRRLRLERGLFAIEPTVRKDKSGLLCGLAQERRRGPWGLL